MGVDSIYGGYGSGGLIACFGGVVADERGYFAVTGSNYGWGVNLGVGFERYFADRFINLTGFGLRDFGAAVYCVIRDV